MVSGCLHQNVIIDLLGYLIQNLEDYLAIYISICELVQCLCVGYCEMFHISFFLMPIRKRMVR